MLIANEVEVPDVCPTECPFSKEPVDQGSVCMRCPIFNCRKIDVPKQYASDGMFCLIEPECYRKDWALIWKQWFDGGMIGFPELYL